MAMSDYSLSDIAAVTDGGNRDNGGWDNGSWWWIILLFLVCGWGGNGWGNNGGGFNGAGAQGALTRGDLCMDMNFQDVQQGVRNVNDAVTLGFANLNSTICNQQYDTARMINGLENSMNQGFNAMNISNLQGFNGLQSQIASCCCDVRQQIAETNYNMAQNTCAITNQINNSTRDIVEATNAGTRAILDQMCQDKIDTLQNQLNKAELLASQTAQNQYLISQLRPAPEPAYIVANPYSGGCYNTYSNNGCCC